MYLDGTLNRFDATNGPPDISIPLFQAIGLPPIPHVLSIHNTGTNHTTNAGYLDLAFITWEERDMYGNASSVSIQGDENDSSAFSWYPFGAWFSQTQNVPEDSPLGGPGSSNVSLSVQYAFSLQCLHFILIFFD